MKRLMIFTLAFISLYATAQEQRSDRKDMRQERMENFQAMTADEIATIWTKQMTLKLDLSESQQQQIKAINLDQAILRKDKMEERKNIKEGEKKEMTKDDRVAKMNERLDQQIAVKAKMKEILNEDQYKKWEASHQKGRRDGYKHGSRKPLNRNKQ